MKKIKIGFPSLMALSMFRSTTTATYLEINMKELTIICNCNEADRAKALQECGGKLFEDELWRPAESSTPLPDAIKNDLLNK